ncbi:MAG: AEC family transporter [Betaproteobacteria bacterium]|nr:MAG: AEC family transporter [Betaproteobacteria bacterium]
MFDILAITGPIYVLIALGFGAVRLRILAAPELRALGVFVISFALPALLFKALSQRGLGELIDVHALLVYVLASFLVAALGIGFTVFVQRRGLQAGAMTAMGMAVSNSAFVGLPIAQPLFGAAANTNLALFLVVESLIMLPLLMAIAEIGSSGHGRVGQVLRNVITSLVRNPMILGIVAGVACSLLGVHVPLPLTRAVDMLASSSAPVALFYIGGTLAGLSARGLGADLGVIMAGKLGLHALAVALLLLVLPDVDAAIRAALILNACMPMASIYPIVAQKYGQQGIAAAALVATTVTSFLTISAVVWLMKASGFIGAGG